MRRLVVFQAEPDVMLEIRDESAPPLAEGEVRLQVRWSSLNYKDALAARGNRGVVRQLPLTPGIDAAGEVIASGDSRYGVGDAVLATGHDFGIARDGGWAQQLDSPAEHLVPLPVGLTLREGMIFGTAGFTAMQCVEELAARGVKPDSGEVLVTGATGGVGSIAVALLADAGYRVVASSGKSDRQEWLRELGASEVISREEAAPDSDKPLLRSRWAGAVDTVGGSTLTAVVKTLNTGGAVAACGVVAGPDLDLTVYPFILRGVSLVGVDSAWHPDTDRRRIWSRLGNSLTPAKREMLVDSEVTLETLPESVSRILHGGVCGRVLVRLDD